MTRVSSIFSQILQLIPRFEFESAVRKHNAERHARGFSSWGQFIAMLFCQLGHAKSLREICGGLAASEETLSPGFAHGSGSLHTGLRHDIALAVVPTVFDQLLASARPWRPATRTRKRGSFVLDPLLSLDASVIDLCATMFDWAKFRLTKGR